MTNVAINKIIADYTGSDYDYVNDFHAVFSAERSLMRPGGGKTLYVTNLEDIVRVPGPNWQEHATFYMIHATAHQRALALARTIRQITTHGTK